MPQYAEGDLWDAAIGHADLLLITTNATLRTSDQGLVMGRGAARQMVERFPGIEREAGRVLAASGRPYYMHQGASEKPTRPYGLILLPHSVSQHGKETWLGLFQVKYHWSDPADPDLIRFSAKALDEFIDTTARLQNGRIPPRVALNFPGIGNGRLRAETVRPILDELLPESVTIYRLPQVTDPSARRRPNRERRPVASV